MVALWYIIEGVIFGAYYVLVVLLVNALLAKPVSEQNPLNRLMQKIILCIGAFNLVRAIDLDGVMQILNWRLLDMISANTTMLILLMLMIALFAMLNMAYGSFGESDKKLPNVLNMRRGLFLFWGFSVVVVNSFSIVSGLYDLMWPIGVYMAFIGFDIVVLVLLYNATAFQVARYFGQVSRATRALLLQPAQRHDVIKNALYRLKMVQLGSLVMGAAAVTIFILESYTVLHQGWDEPASSRYPSNANVFTLVAPSVIMQAVLVGANLWAVWDGTVCCTGRYTSTQTSGSETMGEEGSFEPPSATPTFRHMSGAITIRPSIDFPGMPARMSPLTSSFVFYHPNMGLNVFNSGTPGTPVVGLRSSWNRDMGP